MKRKQRRIVFLILFAGVISCSPPTKTEADFSEMPLAFTEIMYCFSDQDTLEYVEIRNVCDVDVELTGITLAGGIDYQFGSDASALSPGEYIVVTNALEEFKSRYPNSVCVGPFEGRLSNQGEKVELIAPTGTRITEVEWDNNFPWPVLADGHGFSLVSVKNSPASKQNYRDEWRNSTNIGGSPGFTDPECTFPKILVSEFKPADQESDGFIELHNTHTKTADISGWILTNRKDLSVGCTLSQETTVGPGGRKELWLEGLTGVTFSNTEQTIYLVSAGEGALTGYCHGIEVFGVGAGHSVGLHDQNGEVVLLANPTPGEVNSAPACSDDLIISEIMYHPASEGYEYIEIVNVGESPLHLGETAHMPFGWKIGGIDFTFPAGAEIPGNEIMLLVKESDSSLFKETFTGESVGVFYYSGKLSNKGECVSIEKPIDSYVSETGDHEAIYTVIDRVSYEDRSPWPTEADGEGYSLVRDGYECYGTSENWKRSETKSGNPGEI